MDLSRTFLSATLGFFAVTAPTAIASGLTDRPTEVIASFGSPGPMPTVKTRSSVAEHRPDDGVLVVTFGTDYMYPNARLSSPSGSWDLDAFEQIEVDVTNLGDATIKLGLRVDNPGATGRKNSIGGGAAIEPGQTETIEVRLVRKFAEELKDELLGMDHTPWGVRGDGRRSSIDASNVVELNFFVSRPIEEQTIAIGEVRATGAFDPASLTIPEPFFPFVDAYGQYIHADWPGKVTGDQDLLDAAEAEAAARLASPRPSSWNAYGGWGAGPRLESTGHFRTAKHEGKWYLVDPDGRLFFSLGIDVVRPGGGSPIKDRDHWFADPIWERPEFAEFVDPDATVRRDDLKGKTVDFNFGQANLKRKYGEDWYETWLEITPKRMMNWGFNTIANWSDDKLFADTSLPYTDWVFINSAKLPWQPGTRNRVSDPFNPMLEKEVRRRARNFLADTKDDPWCIGVFLDNELSWGDESHLARGVIEQGKPELAAKQAFVDWLTDKYGDIATLNAAWGLDHASWEAMLEANDPPTTEQGEADLVAFNELIVHGYFRTVRDVLKEVAPDKLYLGCRFAGYNEQVVRIAAEYVDVLSFNLYMERVAGWRPPGGIDMPVIIGEFHFGASDRGVFGNGLRKAYTTERKAEMFGDYVRSALANPYLVGAHWFQYGDQMTTGRTGDAENHGIGFVSITDTPHDDMIEASRDVAADLYTIRGADGSSRADVE